MSINPIMISAIPAAACAVAGAMAYVSVAPRCGFWAPVIHHGDAGGSPRYALTFDDGPCENATPRILDALAELDAKAAFFVIGVNARRNPAMVKRIYNEGHVVANHSFDHSHFGMMRWRPYWERQLRDTDDLIEEIIGVRPTLFRPPLGVRTGHIARALRRTGHTLVTWSRRGLDGLATTSDKIVARLAGRTRAGDILVLHDGIDPNLRRDPSATIAAVKPLILALRQRGLAPASLDQLISVAAYRPQQSA